MLIMWHFRIFMDKLWTFLQLTYDKIKYKIMYLKVKHGIHKHIKLYSRFIVRLPNFLIQNGF